jgi:hypothetical protein
MVGMRGFALFLQFASGFASVSPESPDRRHRRSLPQRRQCRLGRECNRTRYGAYAVGFRSIVSNTESM